MRSGREAAPAGAEDGREARVEVTGRGWQLVPRSRATPSTQTGRGGRWSAAARLYQSAGSLATRLAEPLVAPCDNRAVFPRPTCVDRRHRPRNRRLLPVISGTFLATLVVLCGACASPSAPVPPQTPPSTQPPTPPVNTAPVLSSITASVARAEVNEWIAITADVEDAETPVDALAYAWAADAGEFAGTGRVVAWRLPSGKTDTPLDLKVTLTVIESYGSIDSAGVPVRLEHRIVRNATLSRVHDSPAELSKMAIHFLVDLFGNSSVKPEMCLVDFSDACRGKLDELHDIQTNRSEFLILAATARVTSVTLDAARTSASIDAPCAFRDRHLPTGKEGTSAGTCKLTAVYENRRWWLCSSGFQGTCGSCDATSALRPMTMREFFLSGLRDR